MMFWEVLFGVFVGGLLVISVVGYCGVIFWKWVVKDLLSLFEDLNDFRQQEISKRIDEMHK